MITQGCCGGGCGHQDNTWEERVKRSLDNERSVFQKYADMCLVERDNGDKEVNEVPMGTAKSNLDGAYEIINVTVDSGAYNTVGPPHVGTYFKK